MLKRIYEKYLKSPFRGSKFFSIFHKFFTNTERETAIKKAMEFVANNSIEGDYHEFGVYDGDSFVLAYKFSQLVHLNNLRFFAYDSFKGLPEIKNVHDLNSEFYTSGQFPAGLNEFKERLLKAKVPLDRVKIINGWYNQTLKDSLKKKHKMSKASVIFVDCNLYGSTAIVLKFITDLIQDGTILIIDDWFCFKNRNDKGQQKAFYDWVKENPQIRVSEYFNFDWHGKCFILNLKNK